MTATAERFPMKNEQRLLNLICIIAALGLFAFVGYNFIAAGTVISTDGLFFTVVPIVIALAFLAVPAQEMLMRKLEKRKEAKGELPATAAASTKLSAGTKAAPAALRTAPALKDPKGRPMPPDVNRMVAEMNKSVSSKQKAVSSEQ